jgi:heme exporter protein D
MATDSLLALEYAERWTKLPPQHLKIALASVEAERVRQHELRMAKAQAAALAEKREHVLWMTGLIAAFMLCVAMVVGSVITARMGFFWLSVTMCGPSLIALATLFVLRKPSTAGLQESARLARSAMNSAQNQQQPTGPSGTGLM